MKSTGEKNINGSYGLEGTLDNNRTGEEVSSWKFWKKRRYILAILGFFGFFNVYCLRVNMSIAIVAMTENRTIVLENGTEVNEPEFNYSNEIQGYILSAFFYGYITTQLLGGYISLRIGGKHIFGASIAITSALTLLTPWLAKTHVNLLIAVRVLEGVFEGVTYPSTHALLAKWAPPLERSRMSNIAFSGCFIGTVFAMPMSAYLSEALGWQSIFYVFGSLGLIWYVFWFLLISDTPESDKWISATELKYISDSLNKSKDDVKPTKVPWKSIFTSLPVWAIIVSHFSENWGFYTMLTQLPKFLKDSLNYNLGHSGFVSALPYLVMSIIMHFSAQLADWFLVKGILTTTQVRKIFNSGAFLSQTVFMMAAAYWSDKIGTPFCITMAVGLGGFAWSGFSVNYLDVAPQHASILMGLGNTFGTIPGILSPIITGYIVKTPSTELQWQIVFYIGAGIYLIGAVVYGTFASGEVQPWALEGKVLKETNAAMEEKKPATFKGTGNKNK